MRRFVRDISKGYISNGDGDGNPERYPLSTYLDIRFTDIGGLEEVSYLYIPRNNGNCSLCLRAAKEGGGRIELTKPLTMILLSPRPIDGPVGIDLEVDFAFLTVFLTPPTGAIL